jgi:hypothetical protein
MDKKKNNQISDEEFKLQESESESTSHFSDACSNSDAASTILEKTQRHHIFLIVFILFASLGIYKLVSNLIHRAHTSKPVSTTKLQKLAVPAIPPAVQANNVFNNRLTHLAQDQQEIQTHLKSLDSELSDIKSILAELNSRISDVNEQTQLLHTQQEAFFQKQQKATMQRAERKKLAPKPVYYVRAIIPGRVWLSLQDGSTLTLGIGDKLTGYGEITAIDPDRGTIALSSGAIIGYNPDDR